MNQIKNGHTILILTGIALVLFLLIQFIPFGHDHTNPPVVSEPNWNSPATRDLAKQACFDCHSNETVCPWYSNVAPVSRPVVRDVVDGRIRVNISERNRGSQPGAGEIQEIQAKGEMPPSNTF